jgi:uncharacterized membrane protein YkoI
MRRRTGWAAAVAIAAVVGIGAGGSAAVASGGEEPETPITGTALRTASAAALAYTGGGTVTDSEVGDEESYYEVEVTLRDGKQVDVQLDKAFAVVGSKTDSGDSDGS